MSLFAPKEWVRRKTQPKLLGIVVYSGERQTLVQFGASGPIARVRNTMLERVSPEEIERLGYGGIL